MREETYNVCHNDEIFDIVRFVFYIAREIIEHQFGTIKWVWGFDRYYTKGIEFAQAENALRFTAYNLRRAINIV
ncbi:MAG: transposase, partial [Clostridia bacterium]|nr:transposase [Clostridia bacterium]